MPRRVVAVLAGAGALLGAGTGVAGAATAPTDLATNVIQAGISAGLTGQVGAAAVLVGAAGLTFGLVRRHRHSVARRRAEAAAAAVVSSVSAEPANTPSPAPETARTSA